MRLHRDINHLPAFRNPVVTVGSFDGVHRGHSYLLGILRERARERDGETIVVTFADHPRRVLGSDSSLSLLTSLGEKALLLEKEGIDNLVVMPFDRSTSSLSPEQFVRDILTGKLGARELVAGYNHRFGRNKEGNSETLRNLESKYGFRIFEAGKFWEGKEKISSTAIRDVIRSGDMEHAARLLGHPYIVAGSVGEDGRFNFEEPLKLLPPPGKYDVDINGRESVLEITADGIVAPRSFWPGDVLISF